MTLNYDKSKAIKLFFGSTLFVVLGIYLIIYPEKFSRYSSLFNSILGYVTVIFFGLGIYVSIRMFFQKKPSFEINWEGITYDLKKSSTFIAWKEIESFSEMNIYDQRMILVHVKNPQDYISREGNLIKRKLMEFNYNNYKAPISILPSMYNISLDQLKASLEKYSSKQYGI